MSSSSNPEDNIKPKKPAASVNKEPPIDPTVFNPFPNFNSDEYLKSHDPVQTCYLDEDEKIDLPDIYAYPGIPQNMTSPFFGSLEELGINDKVCFERFGRFGTYGYSYSREEGGLGMSEKSEKAGSEKIWTLEKKRIDYRNVDWGSAAEAMPREEQSPFREEQDRGRSPAKGGRGGSQA